MFTERHLQAGDVEPAALVMLSLLLNNNTNIFMVEYLMAAMWILLRNPRNRKLLATAFQDNPLGNCTFKQQMQDAIDVQEASEAVDELALPPSSPAKGKPSKGKASYSNNLTGTLLQHVVASSSIHIAHLTHSRIGSNGQIPQCYQYMFCLLQKGIK